MLTAPAFSEEPAIVQSEGNNTAYEEVLPNEEVGSDEIANTINAVQEVPDVLPYKQPVSKKKTIKKFLLAMLGVGLSSLIIYIGLTLYNKLRDGFTAKPVLPNNQTSLTTPDTLNDAVKSFLEKTKWEN